MTLSIVAAGYDPVGFTGAGSWVFNPVTVLGHTPAVGNRVVILFVDFNAATVDVSGLWTSDNSINNGLSGTSGGRLEWWHRDWDGSEPSTFTFTNAATSGPGILVAELNDSDGGLWHFAAGGSVLTAQVTATPSWGASGTLPSNPGIAIGGQHTGSVNVTLNSVSGGGAWTVRSGATENGQAATLITSSTTAITPTATLSTSSTTRIAGWGFYYTTPLARPNPVPMTLTMPAPTISADSSVTPNPVPMTMAFPAPGLSIGGSVTPSPVAMAMAFPAPDILSGQLITPTPLAMTLLLPAPTVRADQSAFPSPVAMSMAFPAPTILVTIPVFPTPVEMAFGFPPPSVVTRFGPVPVFALGRAPMTGPADRYPEPPYDSARAAPPVQYRDGLVPYDPTA